MAHGGSNFGFAFSRVVSVGTVTDYVYGSFWAGANFWYGKYQADLTSYDYDAPISEAGDHGIGSDG